jgi:CDP-diacylglycerol--serine O-phosphatidyltransferase
MIAAAEGDYKRAGLFILAGAFFDAIDGIAARITKAASDFGVELDSLCDAVSFGVAPSFLMYQVYFHDYGNIGMVMAAFQGLMGVLRLARFNVELTSLEDKEYFKGLPIPGAALLIVAFILTYFSGIPDEGLLFTDYRTEILNVIAIAIPLLMVSNIKFENLPRPNKQSLKSHPYLISYILIGILSIILIGTEMIFPLFAIFIIFGTVRQFYLWILSKSDPEQEVDVSQETIDSNKAPFEF